MLNTIRSWMPSFNAAYETVKQVDQFEQEDQEGETNIETDQMAEQTVLQEAIRFNHVSYRYPNTEKYILKDLDFTIKAKTSVGIIGPSGAGKSTFVDVLLGLLIPEKGNITMDGQDIQKLGVAWNRNVGYVPQSVYLVDSNIRENIAFGIPTEQIDDKMVWDALEMAQLADFVKKQPDGLDTYVGERGIKFSGGQRQRAAIARALYLNPDILILDEATAALDNETEKALMEAIEALQGHKTLVVVAHRLTTVKHCDHIYEVTDGTVIPREKSEIFGEGEL
jgi:ABC-type multidrug transport system fused ATPase/permease subunit